MPDGNGLRDLASFHDLWVLHNVCFVLFSQPPWAAVPCFDSMVPGLQKQVCPSQEPAP